MTSKCFSAQLPALSDGELERLRCWGEQNCAESVLRRDGPSVMWYVLRERARTREDFARAVRSTLKRLSIDVSQLKKGHWLTLTCGEVVRSEAVAQGADASAAVAASPANDWERSADKVILLSAPCRRVGTAMSLTVAKEG